ncbi:hypothetical protein [Salinicola tamaricis]|uniref:hypothetical protein n=1 Tax=Salinicola tamaricis TaxID=1771309 RepID=UPI0013EAF358
MIRLPESVAMAGLSDLQRQLAAQRHRDTLAMLAVGAGLAALGLLVSWCSAAACRGRSSGWRSACTRSPRVMAT